MSTPIRYRVQEWLADHFSQVQYPHIHTAPQRRIFDFKYQMSWWQRIVMIQWALAIILIGCVLLSVTSVIAYVMIKAIFMV